MKTKRFHVQVTSEGIQKLTIDNCIIVALEGDVEHEKGFTIIDSSINVCGLQDFNKIKNYVRKITKKYYKEHFK